MHREIAKKQRRTLVCVQGARARVERRGRRRGRPPGPRGGKTGHRQDRAWGFHTSREGGGGGQGLRRSASGFHKTKPRARHGRSGRAGGRNPQHRHHAHTTPPRGPAESRRESTRRRHYRESIHTAWAAGRRILPEPTFSSPAGPYPSAPRPSPAPPPPAHVRRRSPPQHPPPPPGTPPAHPRHTISPRPR